MAFDRRPRPRFCDCQRAGGTWYSSTWAMLQRWLVSPAAHSPGCARGALAVVLKLATPSHRRTSRNERSADMVRSSEAGEFGRWLKESLSCGVKGFRTFAMGI